MNNINNRFQLSNEFIGFIEGYDNWKDAYAHGLRFVREQCVEVDIFDLMAHTGQKQLWTIPRNGEYGVFEKVVYKD